MSGKGNLVNWLLFVVLAVIWGSSFVLMKIGLTELSPWQVAAIRIGSAGLIMIPSAFRQFRKIPSGKFRYIIISVLIASVIPAFLFCLAETKIDSSLAGFLNALTPIFAIITGILFYNSPVKRKKIAGVLIAFCGMLILFLAKGANTTHFLYALLVIAATVMYGYNVNMAREHLQEIPSSYIVSIGFTMMVIPCLIILYATGFFSKQLLQHDILIAWGAGLILGIIGTALAFIFYYMLIKSAGPLFTAMVTYGIPFVALFWGLLFGEHISYGQVIGLVIILSGVYVTNRT